MSENVNITPGSGDVVGADEIGGIKYQRIKLILGDEGANDGDVSATNKLPVTGTVVVTSTTLPSGAATLAEQQAQSTKLDSIITELGEKTEPANTQTIAGAVSVSSSALPTGAATLVEQQAQSTKLDSILAELGQKTEPANNQNVVFAGSLPAGTNNIGDVDVVSLPALPAGTNNIGDVDVLSLPSLPAGDDNIGNVDVVSLPALPAGTNNIGDVDVASLPALPAGANHIGEVSVSASALPTGAATLAEQQTQSTKLDNILTELGQKTEPANTQVVDQINAAEADYDTGGGTVNQVMLGIALPAAGGPVAGGTLTAPVRIDPTGTTTQPVSMASAPLPSGAATLAEQQVQSTKLDSILTELGQKTEPANNQNVIVAAALPAGTNNIGDVDVLSLPALPAGTNNIGDVDIASALPAGDNNIGNVDVVSLPALPAGSNNIGSITDITGTVSLPTGAATLTEQQAQSTKLDNILTELGQKTEPANTQIVDQANAAEADYDTGGGTVNQVMFGLALPAAGGPVAGGTATAPVRIDPTGATTQPISVASLPLPAGAATLAEQQAQSTKLDSILTELGEKTEPANNQNVVVTAALPAGTNNIGDVDVASLPALPAGTNNIGDVDVLSLPALPAGTNNIGDVDVASLPALPAGANNIGSIANITGTVSLPTGAATLAEQQTQSSSLSVMDDWDESDRAKVNPIAGQAGVQGGSGVVTALTQRVVLATDVPLPAGALALTATTVSTDTEVSVTTSTTALLAANANRKRVWIQNHGAGFVRVRLAATALTTSPIRLVPQVGTVEILPTASGHIYQGVINAISESGTNAVGVIEEE